LLGSLAHGVYLNGQGITDDGWNIAAYSSSDSVSTPFHDSANV